MAHCWGWPKALATGAEPHDAEAVALFAAGDYVIACYTASVQVWAGGQHRLKLGELHRSKEQLEEEGPNLRAHWCPQKRVLAVATALNHLQLYTLNVSSEALWRLPGGGDVRRVNLYLSHSLHLDYGPVRIADLGGDARSLLVALSNGTMQVFSWQGKLRGQANPFIAAYEGSRSRRSASRMSSSSLGPRHSLSADGGAANGLGVPLQPGDEAPAAGTGSAPSAGSVPPSASASVDVEPPSSALLAALAALDLPQPTPAQPADVAVTRVHYCPAARMLAVVLADGRCALCRTSEAGIHPVEQVQLFRWAYKPAGPAAPAAVAAALNPTAQLLALGLSHGRVAIYTLQSLLSLRPQHHRLRSSGSSGSLRLPERGDGTLPPAGGGGAGQPDPARLLSLADWGYRSSVVGPAGVLRWSPDGRVLAVGYGERGMAVWTPSGCRLMCSLRQAVATAAPDTDVPSAASPRRGETAPAAEQQQQEQQTAAVPTAGGQQQQVRRSSTESGRDGLPASPTKRLAASGPGGLWSQPSSLNPGQTLEPGVLEGGISALAWTAHGYQLLVAERGRAATLHQLEFARQVHGAHRVAQPGGNAEELHALQAADRILLITEAQQAPNPSLRLPAAAAATASEQSEAEAAGARPDLVLQHVKLPQHYVDAAYPLLHAAISQDRADVAVAGTRGLAVYSRRTRRWRLFGDATQERSLRVQGLMWLPDGVIAAVAYVDGKDGAAAPQLLLYPQYHLDNASLLARLPLKQVPVAMDSAGWHLALAFHPLEIKLFKVTVEGPLGPAGRPIARLAVVRELSIMGMGNPLQEIALIDPATLPQPGSSGAGSSQSSLAQQAQRAEEHQAAGGAAAAAGPAAAPDPSWPQLKVATKPAAPPAGAADGPLQCVLLRAGGIMSKLDLTEGSEVLLSDAIERFWLPLAPAAAAVGASGLGSRTNSFTAAGGAGPGAPGGTPPSLSASSSLAVLAQQSSVAELPVAAAAVAAQRQASSAAEELGSASEAGVRLPSRVEMPWWTYGARGMQLWFPSSLSEPLTPSRSLSIASPLSLASPTATGLAAAAAAASTNSTDPELEFDREVYPVGVSLAEVSIVGVMQRTVRSQAFAPEAPQSLCFHPLPESQPVLPCLLRRLLQKGRHEDALELARWHSSGPHFNRSLEWLLFTALELDAEQQPSSTSSAAADRPRFNSSYAVTLNSMQQGGAPAQAGVGSPRTRGGLAAPALAQRRAGPLLVAAARLISQFPQFPEIVVSVARKTDAALWPALFAAVGSPARLCQGLMQSEKLQSAACCLVIVEQIDGGAAAQELALQLMQAALSGGQYGLSADLLRFLVPPGEAGEALLESPGKPAATLGPAAATSPLGERQQGAVVAIDDAQAGATQQLAQQAQQEKQEQQEQQQSGGSWFWGLFGVGSSEPRAPSPAGELQRAEAAPSSAAEPAAQARQQVPAAADTRQGQAGPDEEGVAAGKAWRLTGQHAWRLLDAGALREAAQLARALSGLHGGLPALLAATADEAPAAQAQLVPSAAAIASTLFVAANEFAAEQEEDAAVSAELLLAVATEAGCPNLAVALALLLGDQPALQRFAGRHPEVWADLHGLLANDVHLCGYAPMLSPLPSPVVRTGSLPVGALLAA